MPQKIILTGEQCAKHLLSGQNTKHTLEISFRIWLVDGPWIATPKTWLTSIFRLDYIGDYNDDEFGSDEEDYDQTDPDYQQFQDSREMD